MPRIKNCRLRKREHVFTDAKANLVDRCMICNASRPKPNTMAKLSLQQAEKRDTEKAAKLAEIEKLRPAAREVVTTFMLADEFDVDYDHVTSDGVTVRQLVDAALADHRLRHPTSRGDRPYVIRDVVKGIGRCCCRFCGRELLAQLRLGYQPDQQIVRSHLTWCAISSLATAGSAAPIPVKKAG